MTGKPPGYEIASFSETEIYFNYFKPEYIKKIFAESHFELLYRDKSGYREADGSETEEILCFLKETADAQSREIIQSLSGSFLTRINNHPREEAVVVSGR